MTPSGQKMAKQEESVSPGFSMDDDEDDDGEERRGSGPGGKETEEEKRKNFLERNRQGKWSVYIFCLGFPGRKAASLSVRMTERLNEVD